MHPLRPLSAILTLLLGACMGFIGPGERDDRVRDLVAARARWAANGPTDYTMYLRATCFCLLGAAPVRVVVVGGTVVRRELVATGEVLPASAPGSPVDQMFDSIEDALNRRAHRLDVTYDASLGFPRAFFIDYSMQAADEEYGMHVDSLVATPR